jgi:hypothetical protein
MLPSTYHFNSVVVTDENYPGSTHGQGVSTPNLTGTRTTTDTKLDPAMCAVISWKTGVAKRYARGHTFAPPILDSSATSTGGLILNTSAYYLAVQAFRSKFAAGNVAGSSSYVPEIFSKHEVLVGAPKFSFKIVSSSVSGKQHWLRSRSTAP